MLKILQKLRHKHKPTERPVHQVPPRPPSPPTPTAEDKYSDKELDKHPDIIKLKSDLNKAADMKETNTIAKKVLLKLHPDKHIDNPEENKFYDRLTQRAIAIIAQARKAMEMAPQQPRGRGM